MGQPLLEHDLQVQPRSHERGWLYLLRRRSFILVWVPLIWALVYLTNLSVRPMRHEEGRRAGPAREMLLYHHWSLPTMYGDAYLHKPVGAFWILMAAGWLVGSLGTLAIRLPSALAVLAGAFLLAGFQRRQLGRAARYLAGLLLLSLPIMLSKGRLGEIDSLLTIVTFGAMAVWWWGYTTPGRRFQGWIGTGLLFAVLAMLKGPAGLVEFYVPLVVFLLWQRDLRALFTWGHALAVAMGAAPVLLWMFVLGRYDGVNLWHLLHIWWFQIGMNDFQHFHRTWLNNAAARSFHLAHYRRFPIGVISMLMPWIVFAAPMFWPPFARRMGVPAPLVRWLICLVGANFLAFWLWPSADPRHVMVIAYPVCVMAATNLVGSISHAPPSPARIKLLRVGARTALTVAVLMAVATVIFAARWFQPALAAAIGGALVVAIAVFAAGRLLRRTPDGQLAAAMAACLALTILMGRFLAAIDFDPWKATNDVPTLLMAQAAGHWSNRLPIYTTRCEPKKGDDYWDIQFYFGPALRALRHLRRLPATTVCQVLVTPRELQRLRARPRRFQVFQVTRLAVKKGPPPLYLIRVRRLENSHQTRIHAEARGGQHD